MIHFCLYYPRDCLLYTSPVIADLPVASDATKKEGKADMVVHQNVNNLMEEFYHVFMSLNLVLEEFSQEEDAGRDCTTQYKCYQHNDRTLRTNLSFQ